MLAHHSKLATLPVYLLESITSSIGNVLEWYDFGLFAVFSSLFAELFFPDKDPRLNLLATFSIFAIGYLCRPLGGLLFGYLGDKRGRASTLRLSILMISLPTLVVGFLPTYSQVGILAPILLMLVRIWQGISIGGEYSGNIIYLAEMAPQKIRATLTSLAGTGANAGILLATIIGSACIYLFSDDSMKSWGWRLPYLISGGLSLFIYIYRLKLAETPVFEYLQKKKLLASNPIKTTFKKNIPLMLRTIGLTCMGSTYYYFCFVYLPMFFSKMLHFKPQVVSGLMTLYLLTMLFLVPLAGMLCDQIGRRKMLLFNASFIAICIIPGYYFIQHYLVTVGVVMLVFTIASSLEQATTSVAVVENYPASARYTGLSLSYNLGCGIFGGTVPLISSWLALSFNSPLAPAFYIALCALITGLTVYFFVPETRTATLLD